MLGTRQAPIWPIVFYSNRDCFRHSPEYDPRITNFIIYLGKGMASQIRISDTSGFVFTVFLLFLLAVSRMHFRRVRRVIVVLNFTC